MSLSYLPNESFLKWKSLDSALEQAQLPKSIFPATTFALKIIQNGVSMCSKLIFFLVALRCCYTPTQYSGRFLACFCSCVEENTDRANMASFSYFECEERMAQGRLSLESVGRLVERERAACFRSPKAVFERTPSLPLAESEYESAELSQSISDSLADAAFTMEMGDCDVECDLSPRAVPRAVRGPYQKSPYRYSFCAFSNWDGERVPRVTHDAAKTGRRNRSAPRMADWDRLSASVSEDDEAAGIAMGDAMDTHTACTNADILNEIAHAQKALSNVSLQAHTRRRAIAAQSAGGKSGLTPTNIEDGIGSFGDGDGNDGQHEDRERNGGREGSERHNSKHRTTQDFAGPFQTAL